jgi:hypothetical protein
MLTEVSLVGIIKSLNSYWIIPVLGWYHKEHHTLIFLDPSNFEKS